MTRSELESLIGQHVDMSRPWTTQEEREYYGSETCGLGGVLLRIEDGQDGSVWACTDDGLAILFDERLTVEVRPFRST